MSKEKFVKQTFTISEFNDEQLRNRNRRKGDMSKIVNAALEAYWNSLESK